MYTGSYNFTAEHTRFHTEKKWKDLGVRVVGSQVKIAVLSFKKIWNLKEYRQYKKIEKNYIKNIASIQLNHSVFMKQLYYRQLLRNIRNAKDRIWLITPYFIPTGAFIRALGKAAARGVDVQILTSSKSDVKIFQTLQFFYYPFLLKKGAKVYQYTETVLHAKSFIIDDWITIGSSNLNHRSLIHDLEVDLAIQRGDNRKRIEIDFITSTQSQLEVTKKHVDQRSLWDRFLSNLYFIFKYWF
jgi:cardiolipin synthase